MSYQKLMNIVQYSNNSAFYLLPETLGAKQKNFWFVNDFKMLLQYICNCLIYIGGFELILRTLFPQAN